MNSAEILKWVGDAKAAFAAAADLDQLKSARLAHAGDKSPISGASRALGSVPADQKAELGKVIGAARAEINEALESRTKELELLRDQKVLLEEVVDITLPAIREHLGGLHPLTVIKNEISDYFLSLGYSVAEGPEL
ncbi:MAG: phenylalanine--tRNA ligase subunit alpha, partial [Candidatus Nanopelagicaceae bacterium]